MKSVVFHEDCMEVMLRYPDKYFDLALCDVPYGIGAGKMQYVSERKNTVKQKNGKRLSPYTSKRYPKSDWDNAPPPQEYYDELCRVTKHQIIFGVEYVKWQNVGLGRIKWDKGFSDNVSFKRYEVAYCSLITSEITMPLLWAGICQAKSIKEPMTQQGNKQLNERRIHPCHKPVMLYMNLLKMFGTNDMKILDTHLGSGSSRIAADKYGAAEFVGCEIDRYFFNEHCKRWNIYSAQLPINYEHH